MSRLLRLIAVILFCATLPTGGASAQESIPLNFELPTTTGKVNLTQFSGKVVYVDFWASWCAPCLQSFPFMNELHNKYGDKGLRIVAISVDKDRADVDTFLRKNPAQFIIAFDPAAQTAKQYQIKGMPSSYLIGRTGQLIKIHRGFKNTDREQIERSIQEALK